LLKKINHYRARSKANKLSPSKGKTKYDSKQDQSSSPLHLKIPKNRHLPPPSASLAPPSRASLSFALDPRPGSYNFETLSSDDDSDAETVHSLFSQDLQASSNESNHVNFPISIRDTSGISNVSDNVLGILRRRTGDLPPSLTRRTEIFYLSQENGAYESIKDGSDDESPFLSPARPELYPNLSLFSTSYIEPEKFESSDSDLDGNSYRVEKKSFNTNLTNVSHDYDPN
ncbi:unnamed protein product, partial [Lymnaea stagnalis]